MTHIDYAAFCGCLQLEVIILPGSISYIGDKVFINCPKLKKILVPAGMKDKFTRLIPNYANKLYEE